MTNASCADCGRIVAFRTHDPSEIAECRSCGTWVKRSAEMPGVAVSVKSKGPVARKTAIPPRKNETQTQELNPNINTTRSSTKRTSQRDAEKVSNESQDSEAPSISRAVSPASKSSSENLSAASVYASIQELQRTVHDLRAGQKKLQAGQKSLLEDHKSLKAGQQGFQKTQKALHEGQKSLYSGQKQLFEQYQELQQTLSVPDMPVSPKRQHAGQGTATSTSRGPLSSFEESFPLEENAFFTTPFSALKIPLIPIHLKDLEHKPQFTEEGSVPTIPLEERSDRIGLIENPLPEPPPYVAQQVVEDAVVEEPVAEQTPSEASPFREADFNDAAFNDAAFNTVAEAPPVVEDYAQEQDPTPSYVPPQNLTEPEPVEEDSFLTTAAHESPFTIEGPPAEPFTIVETEESQDTGLEETVSPFVSPPQPFGAKEYTHEPCEISDPFAASPPPFEEASSETTEDNFLQPAENLTEEEQSSEAIDERSLSQQIADAKEQQETSLLDQSQKDLLTEPEKSRVIPILGILLGLLAVLGAVLFFFTDLFKSKETITTAPPIVESPLRGIALPEGHARIAEAKKVATQFLNAKTQQEVEALIRPVDSSLLVNFWEPLSAATIERTFQGRILAKDRVEVDFLIKDFGREERLLSLVKIGKGPFQVDWKSFTECEEVTLLGLAQGTLILDNGEEIDEGAIRSWMQSGKDMQGQPELKNYVGFKLHNFTEEVVAFAVARADSPELKQLTDALVATKLKHKGKPAIRAVLKVKRIEKEDPTRNRPARLEILKVLSTDWTDADSEKGALITEELPAVISEATQEEESQTESLETKATETAEAKKDDSPEKEEEEELPAELPPVPAEGDPLSSVPGETPLFHARVE